MNCKTLENEIVPYYLNELPEETRRDFERHLQVCAHCARFAYEMSRAMDAAGEHYPRKAAIDLWPEVQSRMSVRGLVVPRWVAVPAMSLMLLGTVISTTVFRILPAMQPAEVEIVKDFQFFSDYELLNDIEEFENQDALS